MRKSVAVKIYLLVGLILSLASSNTFGQDVLIDLHVSPFDVQSQKLLNTISDTGTARPRETDNLNLDIGGSVLIGNLDRFLYVVDFSWKEENYSNFGVLENFFDPNVVRESSTELRASQFRLGIGIDKPINIHDRLYLAFGARCAYSYRFNYQYTSNGVNLDSIGSTTSSDYEIRTFPDVHGLALEGIVKIMYRPHSRFSLGVTLTNRFGMEFTDGIFEQHEYSYDANGNTTSEKFQNTTGTDNRFAYNFLVSFGVQYQIVRMKEK